MYVNELKKFYCKIISYCEYMSASDLFTFRVYKENCIMMNLTWRDSKRKSYLLTKVINSEVGQLRHRQLCEQKCSLEIFCLIQWKGSILWINFFFFVLMCCRKEKMHSDFRKEINIVKLWKVLQFVAVMTYNEIFSCVCGKGLLDEE